MPLFYQHNINEHAKLAVWHITEPEDFFLQEVHLQKNLHHPHKRLQHLAGRYLLKILHPEFPLHLIEIAESNKPLLPGGSFHFSISHCGDFAAAIISENESAGIDVELVTPKIKLIKHKFLSAKEIEIIVSVSNSINFPIATRIINKPIINNPINLPIAIGITNNPIILLTLCWSTKEAVYKWYGKGGVDFKDHIRINDITVADTRGIIACTFVKNITKDLTIYFNLFENLCLAWVVG